MTDSLASALALVQTKLPDIDKAKTATVQTKSGGSYSYSYADLAQVSRHILPLLGDAGLSWLTKPTLTDDGRLVLEYKLMHVSGECEEGQYPLPQSGSPQEIGSAITYARRYTLCSVTGVAPEQDDDDGAAASTPKAAPRQAQLAAKRTAKRAAPPAPKPTEPDPDERLARTEPSESAGLTLPQQRMMHALFNQCGWTEHDDRVRAASAIVGRKLTTSKELTKPEASLLIDTLNQVVEEDDPQLALTDLVKTVEMAEHIKETFNAEVVEEDE